MTFNMALQKTKKQIKQDGLCEDFWYVLMHSNDSQRYFKVLESPTHPRVSLIYTLVCEFTSFSRCAYIYVSVIGLWVCEFQSLNIFLLYLVVTVVIIVT